MKNEAAVALGKLGGKSRSQKKIDAARKNLELARQTLKRKKVVE